MMAKLQEVQDPISKAIDKHCVDRQEPHDDMILRGSSIGEECERDLWYRFRWASTVRRFDGRTHRIFESGNIYEERNKGYLAKIGCEVDGDQTEVSFLNGLLKGHIDGMLIGVPGAEKTLHLWENKALNDKSFEDFRHRGVEKSKPIYYAQITLYMGGLELDRCLFMVTNKNNDSIACERVKFDPLAFAALIAKAERIAFADSPPPKQESFACRWCRNKTVCQDGAWARVNCRTCLSFDVGQDGKFRCAFHGNAELEEFQACPDHRYVPDLVNGTQIDADEIERTVTYELADGSIWIDGAHAKPDVPEVE